ncbi:uncharacterized protein LOC143626057 [Bidens hawaiensis]|uniref:uncharacterized protein LOC143626057 n=1 Tax=Bidens hawaiensis TaxID=980011 RepID=UPI00404A52F0
MVEVTARAGGGGAACDGGDVGRKEGSGDRLGPPSPTAHHGLSGKQVSVMSPDLLERPWYRKRMLETFSAVKSITSSFFPLVTTAVVAHSLLILVTGTMYFIVATTNIGQERGSTFTWLYVIIIIIIVLATYFHVNWSLDLVVAVVESKYGISALKRSSYLVSGMRSDSLFLFLYFVYVVGVSVWLLLDGARAFSNKAYVLFAMMLGCGLLVSYLREATVAMTVLYNYCKAFHGELVMDGSDVKG